LNLDITWLSEWKNYETYIKVINDGIIHHATIFCYQFKRKIPNDQTISTKEKLGEAIKVKESYFNQHKHNLKVDGGERKKMSEDLAFLFNDDNSVSYAVSIQSGTLNSKATAKCGPAKHIL
jgi:hypothetical protein